jgi:hypothetical protein
VYVLKREEPTESWRLATGLTLPADPEWKVTHSFYALDKPGLVGANCYHVQSLETPFYRTRCGTVTGGGRC